MKLYLLRHGEAGDRAEWKGNDFDRPLTDEGKARTEQAAAAIAKLKLDLDEIVTSPLVRAFQTAEIVARKLKLLDRLVKDERLGPDFGIRPLGKILQAHPSASALMLVGHEPGISETISGLIGGGRLVVKKGGLAYVDLPDPTSLKGELVWLIPPKALAL